MQNRRSSSQIRYCLFPDPRPGHRWRQRGSMSVHEEWLSSGTDNRGVKVLVQCAGSLHGQVLWPGSSRGHQAFSVKACQRWKAPLKREKLAYSFDSNLKTYFYPYCFTVVVEACLVFLIFGLFFFAWIDFALLSVPYDVVRFNCLTANKTLLSTLKPSFLI